MGGGGYPDAYAAGRYLVVGMIKSIHLIRMGKAGEEKEHLWNRMALVTMKGLHRPDNQDPIPPFLSLQRYENRRQESPCWASRPPVFYHK